MVGALQAEIEIVEDLLKAKRRPLKEAQAVAKKSKREEKEWSERVNAGEAQRAAKKERLKAGPHQAKTARKHLVDGELVDRLPFNANSGVPHPPDGATRRRSFGGKRTRPAIKAGRYDPRRCDPDPGSEPDSPTLSEASQDDDASEERHRVR